MIGSILNNIINNFLTDSDSSTGSKEVERGSVRGNIRNGGEGSIRQNNTLDLLSQSLKEKLLRTETNSDSRNLNENIFRSNSRYSRGRFQNVASSVISEIQYRQSDRLQQFYNNRGQGLGQAENTGTSDNTFENEKVADSTQIQNLGEITSDAEQNKINALPLQEQSSLLSGPNQQAVTNQAQSSQNLSPVRIISNQETLNISTLDKSSQNNQTREIVSTLVETSSQERTLNIFQNSNETESATNSTDATRGYEEAENEIGDSGLTEEEQQIVAKLKEIDKEVRNHEAAHERAGGDLIRGKQMSYTVGPDDKRYATSGEVTIDTAEVPDNHKATITKMQRVQKAALAPVEPSSQDRRVAAMARSKEMQAAADLRYEQSQELLNPEQSNAANTSISINSMYNQSQMAVDDTVGQIINITNE